jgi:hypothetical protein
MFNLVDPFTTYYIGADAKIGLDTRDFPVGARRTSQSDILIDNGKGS